MISSAQLLSRLRFRHLSLLLAIDEHRNLHRAAQAVHLAQPSATKLLRDLEKVFGFAMFERLPRGMHPTALGLEVVRFARRALGHLERFAQDVDSKRVGGDGQLVIGADSGTASALVARAIAELKTRRPLLVIRFLHGSDDAIFALLLESRIDLAVGCFCNPMQGNAIEYERLGEEVLCMVVRPRHPLAAVGRVDLKMLKSCTWILPPSSDPLRQTIEQELGQLDRNVCQNVIECASSVATSQLLQASDSIAMMTESSVKDPLHAGLLVRLSYAARQSHKPFGIATRRGERLSSAAEEFRQVLQRDDMLLDKDSVP
jgi:DNA-binding transcriptional LysR family regulator